MIRGRATNEQERMMRVFLSVLVILLLLFTTMITIDGIQATTSTTGKPLEEQAQADDPGIQPEDRFTITDPNAGKGIPPVKILSQHSEYDNALSGDLLLRIKGEVMNPTGEICCAGNDSVWIVATFFDANNEVLGSEVGVIDYKPGDESKAGLSI